MTEDEIQALMRWSPGDQERLRARFPRLHAASAWTIECGQGLLPMVEAVFALAEPDPTVSVLQVETLDGMLRIRLLCLDERQHIETAVADAAAASDRMCEACGEPGDLAVLGADCFATRCRAHLSVGAAYLPEAT